MTYISHRCPQWCMCESGAKNKSAKLHFQGSWKGKFWSLLLSRGWQLLHAIVMFPPWFVFEEKGTGKRFWKLKSIKLTIHKFLLDLEAACFHLCSTWVVHDSKMIKKRKCTVHCVCFTQQWKIWKIKHIKQLWIKLLLTSLITLFTISLRGNIFLFKSQNLVCKSKTTYRNGVLTN